MKYSIYQIKDIEHCNYAFRSYREDSFDFMDYKCIYNGDIDTYNNDLDTDVLEDIYRLLNIAHPKDFKGHSLSVSDIVCLKKDSPVYYYCNSAGWKELASEKVLK